MVMWRQLFLLCLLLAASRSSLRAASFAETRAYRTSTNAFYDGMWLRAEHELEQFGERFPRSEFLPEALLLRAQAQYHQTNSASSIALLTANLDRAGSLADEYRFWIASGLYQQNNFAGAADAYADFVRRSTDPRRRVEALVGEAAARARLADWPRVVAILGATDSAFTQAVQASPPNGIVAHGLLLLAEAQLIQKNFAAVETVLQPLAGRRFGGDVDWRAERLRCEARLQQGRWPEALVASSNLVSLAAVVPANRSTVMAESIALQADVRERLGQRAEARAALQQNLGADVSPDRQQHALLKITELAIADGKPAEAADTLVRFLNQFSNSPAASQAMLSLGEIHLRQVITLLETNTPAATAEATNHLDTAAGLFDRLIGISTNRSLLGRAELDRGWCYWLKGQVAESAPAFERAVGHLPDLNDLVVAQFKLGDAQYARTNFGPALVAYQAAAKAIAEGAKPPPSLRVNLFYQILRASLAVTNVSAAAVAMEEILKQQPRSELAEPSLITLVQGFSDLGRPEVARAEYERFVVLVPDFSRRAEIELILGRAREQQGDWKSAITGYDQWLERFPTNSLSPRVEYQRAWANFQAGADTNAFQQFTNFIARYPTNELAPQAQWWMADWYFRQAAYPKAELNYKVLAENWPQSPLAREARMMAGLAAMGWAGYANAITHFIALTSDTNCPPELKVRAMFAYGGALMASRPAGTNAHENYEEAIRLFDRIQQSYPTNELAVLASVERAKCWMQLPESGPTNAWAAFTQVITNPGANITARSEAQVGRGKLLELLHSTAPPRVAIPGVTNLLRQALDDYLDVIYEKNLNGGETSDAAWVKSAGLAALPVLEELGESAQAEALCVRLQGLLPPLRAAFQSKLEQIRERRAAKKSGSSN